MVAIGEHKITLLKHISNGMQLEKYLETLLCSKGISYHGWLFYTLSPEL